MVSGEENLIKVAQVSWVWALAAALARMCMILSMEVSLKKTTTTTDPLNADAFKTPGVIFAHVDKRGNALTLLSPCSLPTSFTLEVN